MLGFRQKKNVQLGTPRLKSKRESLGSCILKKFYFWCQTPFSFKNKSSQVHLLHERHLSSDASHNFHFHMLLTHPSNEANNFFYYCFAPCVWRTTNVWHASKTHESNPKCAFSELFWSIFAVERLEHAIVLWKLLVCKLCSPSDKSGAFFALDSLLTRRGFSFLSDVERSNFYEVFGGGEFMRTSRIVLIFSRDILTSFGTRCETGLKMSKVWAVETSRACSYPMLQRHSMASDWCEPAIVTDFLEFSEGLLRPSWCMHCQHVIYQSHRIL